MDEIDRITIDPKICHGKPIVRGSRVPVVVLLAAVAAGDPIEQVADDYHVTVEDVLASIAFAAREVDAFSYRRT